MIMVSSYHNKKLGVVVKPVQKPRLALKFIWMENNIGLGLKPSDSGPWHNSFMSLLLLLAKEICLGGAQSTV